jgi:hypothetical protein
MKTILFLSDERKPARLVLKEEKARRLLTSNSSPTIATFFPDARQS